MTVTVLSRGRLGAEERGKGCSRRAPERRGSDFSRLLGQFSGPLTFAHKDCTQGPLPAVAVPRRS